MDIVVSAENSNSNRLRRSTKHDLRNELTSAFIAADVLAMHSDQAVRDYAKIITDALENIRQRLLEEG